MKEGCSSELRNQWINVRHILGLATLHISTVTSAFLETLLLIQTALRRGTASLTMYSSNHHTENTVRAPSCVTLAALLWRTDLGQQGDVVMAPKIHHPSRNRYRRGQLAPSSLSQGSGNCCRGTALLMEIAGEEREQDEWFVCAAVHLHPNVFIFLYRLAFMF